MAFRKKFIVGDETLNTYGTWLLNAGADMSYIKKFSPAYYNHQSWEVPLGHWENLQLNQQNEWEAELVIEGADEREKMFIRKIENGDIKGASFGLDILATSSESVYLKQGQTKETVTSWQPYEISIVPSPGNSNASVLLRNQTVGITLNDKTPQNMVDKILPNINKLNKNKKMDKIALALGLSATADETTILEALGTVLSASKQTSILSKHIEDLASASLTEEQHQFFVELNKTNPTQALEFLKLHKKEETLPAKESKPTKVSDLLKTAQEKLSKEQSQEDKEDYAYLSKNNPEKLLNLKRTDSEKFKQLESDYLKNKKAKN